MMCSMVVRAMMCSVVVEGNDWLYGGDGNDVLYGGTGNDWLYGGIGDDVLYGWTGDDVLYGGKSDDALYGGTGDDSYYWAKGNGSDYIYDTQGSNTLYLTGVSASDVEFSQTAEGVDTITITATGEQIGLNLDYMEVIFQDDTQAISQNLVQDISSFGSSSDMSAGLSYTYDNTQPVLSISDILRQ